MLQLIFDTCVPREEILSGDLSLDLFAAKLRLVVEGNAPQVYTDISAIPDRPLQLKIRSWKFPASDFY